MLPFFVATISFVVAFLLDNLTPHYHQLEGDTQG
jgi:hypothetical protein